MQGLRALSVLLLAAAPVLAAAPAQAAPGSGCPEGFQLRLLSSLGGSVTGQVDHVNPDGYICFRPLNSGYAVVIDNVVS